jgi:hypothetical protein
LYGCETWFLSLKQKDGLRVFKNRAFRRIFGIKGNELTRRAKEIIRRRTYNFYCLHNMETVYKILIGKLEDE